MRILVNSSLEAWECFHDLFKWDIVCDESDSERAGYKVYRDPTEANNWVSDLGDRLEVNTKDGKTINIWIACPIDPDDCVVRTVEDNTVYDKMLAGMTLDKLANKNVQLCCVNSQKLFWVTSYGQLFNYNQRELALKSEIEYLNSTVDDDDDFT